MKKLFILCLCAILFCCAILFLPTAHDRAIYDKTLRLHVLADSDGEEDQARKLRVRDAVLAVTSPLLADCTSQDEARAVIEANVDAIRAAAEGVLAAEGCSDRVEILLGEESYPTRDYDGICFPSGSYLSLRVCIGEAAGQNWWCCLFPPICLGSASVSPEDAEDAFIAVGLTPSQYKIITESEKPVYRVRFKILELLQNLW